MPIDFGCTAAVAIVSGERLIVANAGDAGAVLCFSDAHGDMRGRLLSVAHTASLPSEQARVERDFQDKAYFTPDGYLAPAHELFSAFEVQVTRSLGHRHLHDFGVVSTPGLYIIASAIAFG
jgi:serine/threonine protein phosphatase PrpC